MTRYLLFDLDNTLYSPRYGLEDEAMLRMKQFIAGYLGIEREKAWALRHETGKKYGTSLEWLINEAAFTDVEAYMAAIHPPDEADNLPADRELRAFLECIKIPMAILTNAPIEHVDRILDKLEIPHSLFTHIFDIRRFNFRGKPHRDVYEKAVSALNVNMADVLFIDDYPSYAAGFAEAGGRSLLLDENDIHANYPYQKIRRLRELVLYI
jgi:putative hydrolase of the HAD superfamily